MQPPDVIMIPCGRTGKGGQPGQQNLCLVQAARMTKAQCATVCPCFRIVQHLIPSFLAQVAIHKYA